MIVLIANPTAHSGKCRQVAEELSRCLTEKGREHRLLFTSCAGDAARLTGEAVRRGDCDIVLSVGGDGTIYEVASGLLGTDIPLGIIPAGTGNDFIKAAGIPSDPVRALAFALETEACPVDVGTINDRIFMNVCGTGFDVTVLERTARAKKFIRGRLAYLIGLVQAILFYRPVELRMTVDGETQDTRLLICSVDNGRFIGGGIPICPVAQISDGMLDLVTVEHVPRRRIPLYLPALLAGKVLTKPITHHRLCRSVTFEAPGMKINMDGEIHTMDKVTFGILPGALRLCWKPKAE